MEIEPRKRWVKRRVVPARHVIAYDVAPWLPMPLIPAPAHRDWMAATNQHFANRCLPLLIANQSGWFLLNPYPFQAVWNGGALIDDLVITPLETAVGPAAMPVSSHFGYGILTWSLPYLFRTPPGWNLWARGPANLPKDGIQALEGVIETDWSIATFTMNWKMTRPGLAVTFEAGEPICQVSPQRRGEIEAFHPYSLPVSGDPELQRRYDDWLHGRNEFNETLKIPDSPAIRRGWQKDYFLGRTPDGLRAAKHQTRLALRPFPGRGGPRGGETPGG